MEINFNWRIIQALLIQSVITSKSRILGGLVGYLITTGILFWGLSVYDEGGYIGLFSLTLTQSTFIIICVVWYGFDTLTFINAIKAFRAAKQAKRQAAATQKVMPPDSWACNCGRVNYPSARACQNCLKERIVQSDVQLKIPLMERHVKAYSYLCYLVGLVALINSVTTFAFRFYLVTLVYVSSSVGCFLIGYGIGSLKRWGRIGGIILGILILPVYPLFTFNVVYGLLCTFVGIYGLWALLSKKGKMLFVSAEEKKVISKIVSNKPMEVAMSYCTKCGKEISEGSSFCQHCGGNLSATPSSIQPPSMSSGLTNEDFRAFVGKNSEKYLTKFDKFNVEGIDSFKTTWHWPAFFVPFWWLLYRKIYGWAILAFITAWIPYIGWFLLPIVWAITANYIYYRHAKKKLLEIKQLHPAPETQRAVITVTGGVGNAALIFMPIGLIMIISILAAIAIPQFSAYRQKASNAQAKAEIQRACKEASSIFIDNPQKTITRADLEEKGLKLSPGIELIIHDGTRELFNMSTSYNSGNNIYMVDKNCNITEEVKPR